MAKQSVRDVDLRSKRVLMRVDFNVPLRDGRISDDTRIRAALGTIGYVLEQPGASVVLMSHLGRPKGKPNSDLSLKPVATRLSELLQRDIVTASDCVGDETESLARSLPGGGVLLLENLRFHAEEEANDTDLRQR